MDNAKLKKLLDDNFGPPYLPDAAVETWWSNSDRYGRLLSIKIGRRDIQIDEAGRIIGSGALVTAS